MMEFRGEFELNELLLEVDYFNKGRYSVDENSEEFVSVGEFDLMDFVDLLMMRIKGNNCYKVRVLYERGRVLLGIGEMEL